MMQLCPKACGVTVKGFKLRLKDQCLKDEQELDITKVKENEERRTFLTRETDCMDE